MPSGALGHLIWPRSGSHIAHYSSLDRTGGNADFVSIAPGESHTLAATARVTGGEVRTQDMSGFDGKWGGNEQLWVGATPIELIGKDARAAGYSDGYLVGIDGFLLREVER